MSADHPSRRDFLSTSGSAVGGAWLARLAPLLVPLQACARDAAESGAAFVTFTAREAADFEAFGARIVPTDDTPGAREAGVVYFADRALEGVLAELLPIIREGLADLGVRAADRGGASFAELTEDDQDAVITAVEEEGAQFFFFGRVLVMLGLVTHPDHGGNRDRVGWNLLGFEDRFAFRPPFGYYDRDEHGTSPAGAGE